MTITAEPMEHKFFLIVKVTVRTAYPELTDAMRELLAKTELQLTSTKNVKVLKHEILRKHAKTH